MPHSLSAMPSEQSPAEIIRGAEEREKSEREFLKILFQILDDNSVRYCVLHSWRSLPDAIATDLDIGVHPDDKRGFAATLAEMKANGYSPVQNLNYFVNAYYIVFAWFEGSTLRFAALDIIFEHRRGGIILPTGETMVANRRREKNFWIPDPAVEFGYLLSKKAWKRSISMEQVHRLQRLVSCIGVTEAEQIAGRLFGAQTSRKVVASIEAETIGDLIPKLAWQTWKTSFRQNPLKPLRYLLEDCWRRVQRWAHPTGLFVAFIGPDGVGKSTIIFQLKHLVAKAFRREKVFHWRPGIIRKTSPGVTPTNPHHQPPRSAAKSAVVLLIHFVDYWLGYILQIRPMLARSTFVIFDRYFYDAQADPLRIRYGGPMWLPRLLARLVPQPDMVFVLDAPEYSILERKQELEFPELQRQRAEYRLLASRLKNATVIDTSEGVENTMNVASSVLRDFLARKFQPRMAPSSATGISPSPMRPGTPSAS